MSDHATSAINKRTKNEIIEIRELSQKTMFPWIFDALLDWTIISAMIFLIGQAHNVPAYIIALLVIGNRQHALAVLGHEGAHYTLHADRRLNDFISNLFCFWPLLITTDGYRNLHFIHHNNTGTSKDPELLHKKARAPQWDLPLNKRKVFLYAIKDIFGYSIPDLFIILVFSKPKNKNLLLPVFCLHLVFITASIALGYWWITLTWYIAIATTFMMFFRFRLWIEHQGTFDTQRIELTWLQAAILAPHKIWLHWEHHRWPTVPYHKLTKARTILSEQTPINLSKLIHNLSHHEFLPSGASIDDHQPETMEMG
ncbi:MAG: fatty acid desaturase family protein [Alphaproteobacteria bacterium]